MLSFEENPIPKIFLQTAPPEFQAALDHVRSIRYNQLPDYELLIHLFLSLLRNEKQAFDYNYDWNQQHNSPGNSDQQRRKRSTLSKFMDKPTRQILSLQTHRNQFFKGERYSQDDFLHSESVHTDFHDEIIRTPPKNGQKNRFNSTSNSVHM